VWTAQFWKDTAERAIKTAAQAALGVFTALSVASVQGGFDWGAWAAGLGLTVALSFVTSILSSFVGAKGTASVVGSVVTSTLFWTVAIAGTGVAVVLLL
jgi:hypothetical protein